MMLIFGHLDPPLPQPTANFSTRLPRIPDAVWELRRGVG